MDNFFDDVSQGFTQLSGGKKCCIVSLCLAFVSIIVYIAVALEGVEPTEFALIRNNLSQDIDTERVLTGGLHYVGVFYSLIHFPSIHKSIEFSEDTVAQQAVLSTRTAEGLELKISCAFQYQLVKE